MPQLHIKQVKGATQGSVLFLGPNGTVSENNNKLFWNNTNSALLIGTSSQFGTETLRVYGSQRIDGDLMVIGSFSVLGSASVINTQNLTVQDPIILLASTQSGSPTLDSGLFINRGTGATQAFIWDESASEFSFVQTNDSANVIGNVTITEYTKIRASGATLSQIKITGGAVNTYVLTTDATGLASWTDPATVLSNVNGVTGLGVVNYVPRWLSTSNLSATGSIYDDGLRVGIGVIATQSILHIRGTDAYSLIVEDFIGNNWMSIRSSDGRIIAGYPDYLLGASWGHTLASPTSGANDFAFHVGTNGLSQGLFNIYNNGAFNIGHNASPVVNLTYDGAGSFYFTGGNVGIDTIPTTKLHIVATYSGGGFRLVDTTESSGYILMSDTNGVGTWTSSNNIIIPNGVTGIGVINYVPRWLSPTNLSATGSIYDDGANVGIGTLSPSVKLHVTAPTSGAVDIVAVRPNVYGGGIYLSTTSTDNPRIYLQSTASITTIVLSSDGDTLFNGGNVGIGVGSPSTKLHVVGSPGDIVSIRPNLYGGGAYFAVSGSSNPFLYMQSTASATTLYLNSDGNSFFNGGNVGIGTLSPTTLLHISSASPGVFRLQDTTEVTGYVLTSDANGVGTWQLGGVTGSGTPNYVPYWISATQLSSTSSIYDDGANVGIGTQSDPSYKVNVYGDVNISGTLYATSKSFEIEHPLDSTKRLRYGSLEGPEYGVYIRGQLKDTNIIELPDYWVELVDESSITVNITPVGSYQRIFVDKIENNKVYLAADSNGIRINLYSCYYIVYAERKDIPKIIVE